MGQLADNNWITAVAGRQSRGTGFVTLRKSASGTHAEIANVAPKLNKSDIGSSPESIAAMTATLYISAKDAGMTR